MASADWPQTLRGYAVAVQSDRWMTTRLNPVVGIVVSLLCAIMGGGVIVLGSASSRWFTLEGALIALLGLWGLTSSIIKIKKIHAKQRPELD